MASPDYFPKADDLSGLLTHTSEECSEVIKACCKIQRFGLRFLHLNFERELRDEIMDAKGAMDRLLSSLDRGVK